MANSHKIKSTYLKKSGAVVSTTNRIASRVSSFSISVHTDISEIRDLWLTMEQAASTPIHQTFNWCETWTETTNTQCIIIVGYDAQKPIFILPLERKKLFGLTYAQFIANDYANINFGVFDEQFSSDDVQKIVRELPQLLNKMELGVHAILLSEVRAQFGTFQQPFLSFKHYPSINPSFQLALESTMEATLVKLNGKRRRKKFKNSVKRLEAFGGYEFICAQNGTQQTEIITEFFKQKNKRFTQQGLPDVFSSKQVQHFFTELSGDSLGDGEVNKTSPLLLYALKTNPKNDPQYPQGYCAIVGVSCKDEHMICQFGSFDIAMPSNLSVGELLFYQVIEKAAETGFKVFDFGVGDQLYKRSWCSHISPHYDIAIPITKRGYFLSSFFYISTVVKTAIKSSKPIYTALQKIRMMKQNTRNR